MTCVADYKQEREQVNNQDYIQGLEKFVDSMRGKEYTAIFLADSVGHGTLQRIKTEYEDIYTQISPFADMQLSFSSNSSKSEASGRSEGQAVNEGVGYAQGQSDQETHARGKGENESTSGTDTKGTNEIDAEGVTDTTGSSDGVSDAETDTHTDGEFKSKGVNASAHIGDGDGGVSVGAQSTRGTQSSDSHGKTHGTNHTDSVSHAVSKTLSHGINESHADTVTHGSSTMVTDSFGHSSQYTESYNIGQSFNLVDTETMTDTFGTSQGITLNAKNRMLASILDRLDSQLERIEECESLGMWNFAAYFLGEGMADTETAANTYYSLVAGNQSGVESSAVNIWAGDNPNLPIVTDYITRFLHPVFQYNRFGYEGDSIININPSALVSTNELAIHMGLPRYSVKGLPVVSHAVFAKEVLCKRNNDTKLINLGNIQNLGEETRSAVNLDLESLTMHTFVTGSTGTGKSNTVYHILEEVKKSMCHSSLLNRQKVNIKKYFLMCLAMAQTLIWEDYCGLIHLHFRRKYMYWNI